MSSRSRSGAGPSPNFGTRTITLVMIAPDLCARRAVLAVCYACRELDVSEIREILTTVGLDPRDGLTCEVHDGDCYAASRKRGELEETDDEDDRTERRAEVS